MVNKIWKGILLLTCVLVIATGCGKSENEISLGSWDGNTYKNEFLNVTYNKPEDWTRYTDEQIKDVMNLGSELTDASTLSKKLAELTSVTYMMSSGVDGSNVILMSEKNLTNISGETYAGKLKTQLENLDNLSYQLSDVKKETIDGKEFVTLEASVQNIKQKYYIYKLDKHIVSLIVTVVSDDVNSVIEQFDFN